MKDIVEISLQVTSGNTHLTDLRINYNTHATWLVKQCDTFFVQYADVSTKNKANNSTKIYYFSLKIT